MYLQVFESEGSRLVSTLTKNKNVLNKRIQVLHETAHNDKQATGLYQAINRILKSYRQAIGIYQAMNIKLKSYRHGYKLTLV